MDIYVYLVKKNKWTYATYKIKGLFLIIHTKLLVNYF